MNKENKMINFDNSNKRLKALKLEFIDVEWDLIEATGQNLYDLQDKFDDIYTEIEQIEWDLNEINSLMTGEAA